MKLDFKKWFFEDVGPVYFGGLGNPYADDGTIAELPSKWVSGRRKPSPVSWNPKKLFGFKKKRK